MKIREVEPLLREPLQVQILGYSHILHDINHLVVVLLTFIDKQCIQPVESILRAFTMLPLGRLAFLLSSGGVAFHFHKINIGFGSRKKGWI